MQGRIRDRKHEGLCADNRMNKNDCRNLTMKLNMYPSFWSNLKVERSRMNYVIPRGSVIEKIVSSPGVLATLIEPL